MRVYLYLITISVYYPLSLCACEFIKSDMTSNEQMRIKVKSLIRF